MLHYPFVFEKIRASFIERKNRFVVSAEVGGKQVDCYLPNPGRLWELLIPNETELILVKNNNSEKLPYTVVFCKKDNHWVLLHTHITNKIIKDLIDSNLIDFYKDFQVTSEEIRVNGSRFDLLLQREGKKIYLEVKTCTLFGREIAMFPDAITSRGKKHLLELKKLNSKDISTSVLFVVMNPEIKYFLPAYHIDYEFSKAFMEVKDKVEIRAVALDWDTDLNSIKSVKELKIPFSFLKRVLNDRGAYILVIYKNESELVRVGQKEERLFLSGFYVYAGKAKKGLFKRINRHKRKNKKMHWHIDYLLSKAEIVKDFPILTDQNIECSLAESLLKISDGAIPQFGSSDCQCLSHLFYFKENPVHSREFIELVNFYRIDMLDAPLSNAVEKKAHLQ